MDIEDTGQHEINNSNESSLISQHNLVSLGLPPQQFCPLTFVAYMNKIDVAWFKKVRIENSARGDSFKMESFDSIECITIERFYQNFIASNGSEIYRHVALGLQKIDLKKMEMHEVSDDGQDGERFEVVRGNTY